jgi:hypothetical protein
MRRARATNSRLGAIEIERKNIASQQGRLAERQAVTAELHAAEQRPAQASWSDARPHRRAAAVGAKREQASARQADRARPDNLGRPRSTGRGCSAAEALKDLEAKREGVSEGVKASCGSGAGQPFEFVRGLVADVLRRTSSTRRWIEAALDGRDQWLVPSAPRSWRRRRRRGVRGPGQHPLHDPSCRGTRCRPTTGTPTRTSSGWRPTSSGTSRGRRPGRPPARPDGGRRHAGRGRRAAAARPGRLAVRHVRRRGGRGRRHRPGRPADGRDGADQPRSELEVLGPAARRRRGPDRRSRRAVATRTPPPGRWRRSRTPSATRSTGEHDEGRADRAGCSSSPTGRPP